jgi:hypothetical protein
MVYTVIVHDSSWVQVLEAGSCRNTGKCCVLRPKVIGLYVSGSYVPRAALIVTFNLHM